MEAKSKLKNVAKWELDMRAKNYSKRKKEEKIVTENIQWQKLQYMMNNTKIKRG